jgi:hypothetical protein
MKADVWRAVWADPGECVSYEGSKISTALEITVPHQLINVKLAYIQYSATAIQTPTTTKSANALPAKLR